MDIDTRLGKYGTWVLSVFFPLAKLPVQAVAVCGYLEPLSAVVFAALILGETMTLFQILGAVGIIGSAMIGELLGRSKRDKEQFINVTGNRRYYA